LSFLFVGEGDDILVVKLWVEVLIEFSVLERQQFKYVLVYDTINPIFI